MKQRQEGFTLIEMVLATAIVGAFVVVLGMTITTLMMNSQQPPDRQILLQQVQNAGYYIPRDINMSSNVTLSAPSGFPITINIAVDQDENHNYDVVYLLDSAKLMRKQYNYLGSLIAETLIAQYVDVDNTTCDNVTESLYRLTVRVSKDEEAVTVNYEARQRLAAETESE